MHALFHIQTCGELLFGQSRARRERRQARMFIHVTKGASYVTHFKGALSFGEA